MKEVAIIGMSGRFPEAENINQFYQNLRTGRDSVRRISRQRIKNTLLPGDQEYEIAGFLEDIDLFDHEFFGISYGEASAMDPHQRLALQVALEAIEDAGYNYEDFDNSNTAVFAGNTLQHYYRMMNRQDPTVFTGNMNAALAGRISRFFNLRGAAMMIDTTCSSSMTALHYGCREINNQDADQVLVAGLNINLFLDEKSDEEELVTINAPDGKAKTFSNKADGTAHGEAVVCLLLKSLEKAIADGDNIHAVVKGSALNQDAALSGSLTAPSSTAQSEVIQRAWKNANVEPSTIGYIEAHGTGTKLGDPIEIKGIDLAFEPYDGRKRSCAISALKSNIGHSDFASGLAGVVKVVLSLKHQELFPSLHARELNPFIDFENSYIYVNRELKPWQRNGTPRRAGVSAFGMSGTNAHVILEEAPERTNKQSEEAGEYPIVLSAKNKHGLQRMVNRLRLHLKDQKEVSLSDLSYTLTCGRKHHPLRFATTADTVDQLIQKLTEEVPVDDESQAPEKTVLLFSDLKEVELEHIRLFSARFEAFATHFASCEALIEDHEWTPELQALSFQYAYYHLLNHLGIKTKLLLGQGLGETTIAVITGKVSLAKAINDIQKNGSKTGKDIELSKVVEKFNQQRILFVEVGNAGPVTLGLKAMEGTSSFSFLYLEAYHPHDLSRLLNAAFLQGYELDWSGFFETQSTQRLSLPTYDFEKSRCWFADPVNDYIQGCFHQMEWRPDPLEGVRQIPGNKTYLLLSDKNGLADSLKIQLENQGNTCLMIHYDESVQARRNGHYYIKPGAEQDLTYLLQDFDEVSLTIDGIIDLSEYGNEMTQEWGKQAEAFFLDKCRLLKAFQNQIKHRDFLVSFVGSNVFKTAREEKTDPRQRMADVLLRSVLSDHPLLKIKSIDAEPEASAAEVAVQLMDEVFTESPTKVVAYRSGERLVPYLRSARVQGDPYMIKEEGVYLITGGTGGIGLDLCKYLSKRAKCQLILLSRSELPSIETWDEIIIGEDDRQKQVVKTLMEVSGSGTQVIHHRVDISNEVAMKAVFDKIRDQFDQLDGVIHLAGINWKETSFRTKPISEIADALKPKVTGTLLLDRFIEPFNPSFFAIASSLNAIVPRKNSVEHAAGNAFVDAFVEGGLSQNKSIFSLNWPGWYEINRETDEPIGQDAFAEAILKPISTEDGLDSIFYGIGQGDSVNHIVADFDHEKFKSNPFFKIAVEELETQEKLQESTPEPETSQDPSGASSVEAQIIQIWKEVLMTDKFGLNDDFFEIGGHSLNGAQVTNRIEKEFNITMDIDDLFDYATIADLVGFVERESPVVSSIESQITQIWKDVLMTDKFGLHDDFFEIGGHSLNGAQVTNRIEKEFNITMDIDDLFDYATIVDLVKFVEQESTFETPPAKLELIPMEEQDYYELSPAQRNFWVLSQSEQGAKASTMRSGFLIEGEVDPDLLTEAMTALIDRHESLRTTFVSVEGMPKQRVLPRGSFQFKLTYADLRDQVSMQRNLDLSADDTPVFDLTEPPFQLKLIRLEDRKYLLRFTLNHILGDGWSLELFYKELFEYYLAQLRDREISWKPLTLQYKDYSAWLNQILSSTQFEEHRSYWLDKLKGEIPSHTLPSDHKRTQNRSYKGAKYQFSFDDGLVEQIRLLTKKQEVTSFMMILGILRLAIFRVSNQNDSLIGTTVFGRNHGDLEGQFGNFLNTLVLRNTIEKDQSFSAYIKEEKSTVLEAFNHAIYPFESLADDLALTGDGSSSIFNVYITWLNYFTPEEHQQSDNDFKLKELENDGDDAVFDFEFVGLEEMNVFQLVYNRDLFEGSTIEKIAHYMEQIALMVVENPEQSLSEVNFQLLDEDEKKQHKALGEDLTEMISEDF